MTRASWCGRAHMLADQWPYQMEESICLKDSCSPCIFCSYSASCWSSLDPKIFPALVKAWVNLSASSRKRSAVRMKILRKNLQIRKHTNKSSERLRLVLLSGKQARSLGPRLGH